MLDPDQARCIFSSGLNRNEQIEALLDLDFSTSDIQRILKCSHNTISKVNKSHKTTGYAPSTGKIGSPTKKTKEGASIIVQKKKKKNNDPYNSASDLQHSIQNTLHTDVCLSTLNDFRKELGFKFLPPMLTPQHIEKRMNF